MRKILICEDERDVRDLLNDLLLKNGYDVYNAEDGKIAIDKTRKIKPDLILLDIRMPKLNGLDVAKVIRKFDKKPKIIFLTGFKSPELSKEAAKYDISDYIVKNASTTDILNSVQNALKT